MPIWRKAAPATLLLGATLLSIVIACLSSLVSAGIALGIGLVCLLDARPDQDIKRMAAANVFLLFMWLIVPFTTPGESVFNIGIFSPARQGIMLCLLITLKANAIIAIFCAFLANMTSIKMASAMHQLHVPDKIIWLILLMERNISMLGREWRRLEESAKLRCFNPGANLRSYRILANLLAILILFAQKRAKRAHEAMLLAGFDGSIPFSWPWRIGLADILLLLLVAIIVCAIFIPGAFLQ